MTQSLSTSGRFRSDGTHRQWVVTSSSDEVRKVIAHILGGAIYGDTVHTLSSSVQIYIDTVEYEEWGGTTITFTMVDAPELELFTLTTGYLHDAVPSPRKATLRLKYSQFHTTSGDVDAEIEPVIERQDA